MSLPLHSAVVARSSIGLGAHGNSAPVGSASTGPSTTSVGMPSTSKAFESALLRSRSANGSASHGISEKYSAKLFSSRSDETKMSSRSSPFSLYALYASASFGVKPRHGGHQCAEK